jgi:FkbM family methyltransferase
MLKLKLFGRNIPLRDVIFKGAEALVLSLRILVLFRKPFSVIRHYLGGTSPQNRLLELRSGLKINLSTHPHDLITALVIFARKDYGKITAGSVVFDIGSNIGTFALYAAYSGAKNVFAVEPNSESFATLLKNIQSNNFETIIVPIQSAISDEDDLEVLIPVSSSPYNSVINDLLKQISGYEKIRTKTIKSVITQNEIAAIDLLKIDCEGYEFTIVPTMPQEVLEKIKCIKMEYQGGDAAVLIDYLKLNYFKVIKHHREERFNGGMLWLNK